VSRKVTAVIVRYDSQNHDENEPILAVTEVDDKGIPHATFGAMRRFLYAWATNDPNGTWAPETLSEVSLGLHYEDENGENLWPADGRGAYRLTQWPWWIQS
jgi:hypothetical protein